MNAKYYLIAKVDVWASIPFAEPPLGDLRFMPPVQKRSWSGERDVSMIKRKKFSFFICK